MNKYNEEYKRYYPKVFGAVFMFILMAIYLITRSDKPRGDFLYHKGEISYLSRVNPFRPESEPREKDFYLILNEYERVFELFTGTDNGDFSPRVNKLSELNIGDEIEIYFEENPKTKNEQINRLLQYLDKNGELHYLRSKADKYIGYFVLGSSGLLLLLGLYMKVNSK